MSFVLDASALLALLNGERGGELVESYLENAVISAVNFVEVGSKLTDYGMPLGELEALVFLGEVPVIDFDMDLARSAIALRDATRAHGLSLADRACLALAIRRGATAVTADREWAKLEIGCKIQVIR